MKNQNVLTNIDVEIDQILQDFRFANEAELKVKIGQIQEILFAARQKRQNFDLLEWFDDFWMCHCWNNFEKFQLYSDGN